MSANDPKRHQRTRQQTLFQHQLLSLLRLRGTNLHRDRCHSEPKIGVQRYA
jgi:hypothetical protein